MLRLTVHQLTFAAQLAGATVHHMLQTPLLAMEGVLRTWEVALCMLSTSSSAVVNMVVCMAHHSCSARAQWSMVQSNTAETKALDVSPPTGVSGALPRSPADAPASQMPWYLNIQHSTHVQLHRCRPLHAQAMCIPHVLRHHTNRRDAWVLYACTVAGHHDASLPCLCPCSPGSALRSRRHVPPSSQPCPTAS
jgi:hypothetical protein